jgi:pro-apoptotic serine protease NMA111
VRVLYYDPIHDYGFLKFNPKEVKRTKVTELPLRPDLAAIGLEIRVIGNDAAQRLTISEGIISLINRNAPEYLRYTDFNINYIQGSAMTSGGSSGSPVIDAKGNVVALNAGSFSNASVALFLPLEHPSKSLKHLIQGEEIPRGTLQAQWTLQPFHECKRLGLPDTWISTVQEKHPDETGMLVVKAVLPGGPAKEKLEEGDVILKINGQLVTRFSQASDILDSSVLKKVNITVQRWQDETEIEVTVEDLHAITPNKYFMISATILHNISYQQAQRNHVPVKDSGVYYTANEFLSTLPKNSAIQSINGRPTKDLDTFVEVFQSIPGESLRRNHHIET